MRVPPKRKTHVTMGMGMIFPKASLLGKVQGGPPQKWGFSNMVLSRGWLLDAPEDSNCMVIFVKKKKRSTATSVNPKKR